MKLGYITTNLKPNISQNSGLQLENLHQERWKPFSRSLPGTTVFSDARYIILTDFLEKGKMITGEYYASLQYRLSEEVMKKLDLVKKKVLDSAPSPCFCDCDIKIVWIMLRNSSASPLLIRLSTFGLLFVSRCYAKHLTILKTWINHTIRMGLKNLSIVGLSVQSWKEIVLRNKQVFFSQNCLLFFCTNFSDILVVKYRGYLICLLYTSRCV